MRRRSDHGLAAGGEREGYAVFRAPEGAVAGLLTLAPLLVGTDTGFFEEPPL
ncbi:MAG: hypothetical protein HYU28_12605 [Actinobacteria bacterium]|nr:hypothetical protein [Actinomycetota bacterium]